MRRILPYALCLQAMVLMSAGPAGKAGNVYSSSKRPRALALIGDRYHSPVYIREGLAKALLLENIPVTFIEETSELNAESLREHQLLIILRDGMNWPNGYDQPHVKWMSFAQEQAIWDFVDKGGGFLALHNAQGLYPANGPYYKLFGGDYGGHPKPYVFTVRIEHRNHAVTEGVEDFEIFDEQHTVKYYLDREHLLLRSIARDNLASEAGWWREMGKGRFVYLAPGHTPEALGHPMMQRLIRNSARWLTESLVRD
jgi:type 1 glutamine amidotransferase